jgi:hypothetical protein
VEISPDKKLLRVSIDQEFTAAEVGELLITLANARQKMEPPVPRLREDALAENAPVTPVVFRAALVTRLFSGDARVWLQHDGFGWLTFEFSRGQLEWLADLVNQKGAGTHPMQ